MILRLLRLMSRWLRQEDLSKRVPKRCAASKTCESRCGRRWRRAKADQRVMVPARRKIDLQSRRDARPKGSNPNDVWRGEKEADHNRQRESVVRLPALSAKAEEAPCATNRDAVETWSDHEDEGGAATMVVVERTRPATVERVMCRLRPTCS